MTKVLCRIPNHVGDCCMALPALRLLEASGITPILTGKRWAEDLFSGMGWQFEPIEGHVLEDLDRIRQIARRVDKKPVGLLFPNSFSSALLYRIGGIRCAGFGTDGRTVLLDKKVPEPGRMHEVKRFYELALGALRAWGISPAWEEVPENLGLQLLARHQAAARNLIEKHAIPEKFVLVAPVARGLFHGKSKAWAHFDDLCVFLKERGLTPIIFPSAREVEETKAACPNGVILPPTTLGNFAALAQRALLVVANDSGVSHIAAAVGSPQIMIAGVTETDRTSPWNPRAVLMGNLQEGWPNKASVFAKVSDMLGL